MYNYPVLHNLPEMIDLICGYCQLNLTCHTALFYNYVIRFFTLLRLTQEVVYYISISARTGNEAFTIDKYIRVWNTISMV